MYIKILVIYFTEMESSAKIPIETQEFMKSQKMLQKKNESKKSSQFQALLQNAIIKTLCYRPKDRHIDHGQKETPHNKVKQCIENLFLTKMARPFTINGENFSLKIKLHTFSVHI